MARIRACTRRRRWKRTKGERVCSQQHRRAHRLSGTQSDRHKLQTNRQPRFVLVSVACLFPSFSVVVLFLKTLLTQQSLDTPFTGGLGSYKLYVLVAHHIERHLALGGSDRPGEIVLSFLYRYGMSGSQREGSKLHCTPLSKDVPLQGPNGASADLSNVFQLDACIELFRLCWERLWGRVISAKQPGKNNASLLAEVICSPRLAQERRLAREKLRASVGRLRQLQQQPSTTMLAAASRSSDPQAKRSSSNNAAAPTAKNKQPAPAREDLSAEQIAAGYGADLRELEPLAAQR